MLDLVTIQRSSPSIVILMQAHASDRIGEYRGYPICSGHILTVDWGHKHTSYRGARAVFFKKNGHWTFLMGDKEVEITPGASPKDANEKVYQMLAARFLDMNPSRGPLPPMLGHHGAKR